MPLLVSPYRSGPIRHGTRNRPTLEHDRAEAEGFPDLGDGIVGSNVGQDPRRSHDRCHR